MRQMKKALLWFGMLTKRLYKKPTFLAILILIPLLTIAYSIMTQDDSGIVKIALSGSDDSLTVQVFDALKDRSQLVQYVTCRNAGEAEQLVRSGKVNEAWTFPENLAEHISAFVKSPDKKNAFIRVLNRQDTVELKLSREVLSGILYQIMAKEIYVDYIRENFPQMADVPEDQLLEFYENADMADHLFSYDDTEGSNPGVSSYLLTPVRGLLSIVVVLGGLATAMYYIQDAKRGTFCWMSHQSRPLAELGCQMVTSIHLCAVSLLTLMVIGLSGNILAELLTILLYSLCVAVFCMMLRRLFVTTAALGTLMPLLIIILLLVCPVFFDIGPLRLVQLLLPPTYYINAVFSPIYFLFMLLYMLSCGVIYLLLGKIRSHQ